MNARLVPSIVLLAAAAAYAQDKPAPPAAPADKAPAAKKERKASPEAEAALTKYASLLHFPTTRYKTLDMDSHCDVPMLGGEVGCKFHLKGSGEVALDIALPEAATQQYPPEQLRGIKKQAASLIGGMFKPFLSPIDVLAKQYDLASSVKDGKTVVEMTRFADGAAWESAKLWFNADGILEKQVGTPTVDPEDPMSAMNAGVEIEMTFEHKKRGDRWTIESGKIVQPMGESTIKIEYYEIKDQAPLPKQLEFTTVMFPEPLVISIHDFVVDGKAVAGTERPKETKAAEEKKGKEPGETPKPDAPKPDAPKPDAPK